MSTYYVQSTLCDRGSLFESTNNKVVSIYLISPNNNTIKQV